MSQENIIELKLSPSKKRFYDDKSSFGIYLCKTKEAGKVMVDRKWDTFSIKGNTVELTLEKEYNAKLIERQDKQWGAWYEIVSIFEEIPKDSESQRVYLQTILTPNQVDAIFKAYPNQDIIELVQQGKFDVSKVHGVGEKSFLKIKKAIVENLEFQEAFTVLSQYGISNNLIIKLVRYYKSAGVLINTLKQTPYEITKVSGIGFKKADAIAMSMGNDPNGKDRIQSAIDFVLNDQANNGHTYCEIDKAAELVMELIGVNENLIYKYTEDTDEVKLVGENICLKKYYNAEARIAKRIKELLSKSTKLNFDPEKFVAEQEEKREMTLTDQQKEFFFNIKKSNVNILTGFAGCGKSAVTGLLIDLLEGLGISYRLLSPTGKAAKVLSGYTKRTAETIHRAIGQGREAKNEEDEIFIEEEFVIVDEHSMVDVFLCDKLLQKCRHRKLRLLFVGDPFQIPSVSAGNVLHDMLESKVIPTTKLDIVFRQKEGGIIDIATRLRLGQKFLKNSDVGIYEFGDNCIVASVPQEKVKGGYQYYFNKLLEKYKSEEVTVVTPTKKSELGTVEINKHIQEIVNGDNEKPQRKYGNDVVFREGDLVINTKNTYDVEIERGRYVDIVNGDIGKVIKVDDEEEELLIDFGFAVVPMGYDSLSNLLHAWGMTMHKMQGSSNKSVIAIADKAHKYQLNCNLLYTAVTRPEEYLVIVSQAETINFAMKKIANLQRNTFLKDMLMEEVTVD
ncbi:AAA family ATPase [Bacillus sp. AG4(2022)]|uniref:AAA family ATPase n=1 Tax=Bacillus sp. AG4(2022) TaxID=2962594 RepID=UPI0028813CA7|nr:AAA family ATPase [Bacillus sp. AG4(2022)]MDT0160303.1 AAA family ATPase [Bacillus sp. AG4(2022)]